MTGGPTDPAFSVVVAHGGPAAAGAIASVLAQGDGDLEVLVGGDAAGHADPRVRPLDLAGSTAARRNAALAAARGRWVAYADPGDAWAPGHLGVVRSLLGRGARLAATAASAPGAPASPGLDGVWHAELQALGPMFAPCQVAHGAGVVEAVGGWPEAEDGAHDGWALWLALADAGERFATDARPTVARAGRPLPTGDRAVGLGVLPDARAAAAASAFLRLPAVQARLRELHVAEAEAWFRELHDAGELVLPDGLGADDLRGVLAGTTPHDTLPPLATRAHPDGVEVVRPLARVPAAHAARIEAVTLSRFPRKHAWLRRAVAAAAVAAPARA